MRKSKDRQYNATRWKKGNTTNNNLQNTAKKTKHKLYIQPGKGAESDPSAPEAGLFLFN